MAHGPGTLSSPHSHVRADLPSTLADDTEVSAAIAALSSVYQPLDSDLTAIAALTTTAFGRTFLDLADAAAARIKLALGTAALNATGDFQPIDSDLTSIAALATTAYGRSQLTLATATADTAQLDNAVSGVPGTKGLISGARQLRLDDLWKDVVADGGVDATGSLDATAQIQALQDAMTSGGIIYVPPNTKVKIAGTVNVTNSAIHFLGGARRTSLYCASAATGDIFNVTGDAVVFNNLRFTTIVGTTIDNAALRTAGFAVSFGTASDSSGITNSDILFQWSGIQSSGSLQFFHHLNIREYGNNAANGQCILVNGTGDRYMSWITTDNGSNPTGFAGVRVTECASLQITNCNFIHTTTCLALEPATGKTVASVEATTCFFDTSVTGMAITPAGTGVVARCKFVSCWFSTMSGNGVTMNGTQWDGISFIGCEFFQNVIGISCPTGGGKWAAIGCKIAQNSTAGISVTASAAHFPVIRGCTIAPYAIFTANATGVIVAAGTYKGLIIVGNEVVNNTTNATLGAVTIAAGEGSWYQIKDNAGINPLTGAAVTTPAVGASTVAVANTTGFPVEIFIKNGTTAPTVVTLNGVAITGFYTLVASAFWGPVMLEPGGTIAFTYTVVPTWKWVGN